MANLKIYNKPRVIPLDPRVRLGIHLINAAEGQMGHHGDDVCGGSCVGNRLNFYFIPTVGNLREVSFFVPARTLVLVEG
jgi:hypothetical protein